MSANNSEHIVPIRTYAIVCTALLILTYTTYRVALIDLGHLNIVTAIYRVALPLNIMAAILIACAKASLVVLYFMHVAYSPRRTRMVILAGIFWMLLLLGLTLADYFTRIALN